MITEKLTYRDPTTGAIEWTGYALQLSKQDPLLVGELARRLIFEYENEKGGAENDARHSEPPVSLHSRSD